MFILINNYFLGSMLPTKTLDPQDYDNTFLPQKEGNLPLTVKLLQN